MFLIRCKASRCGGKGDLDSQSWCPATASPDSPPCAFPWRRVQRTRAGPAGQSSSLRQIKTHMSRKYRGCRPEISSAGRVDAREHTLRTESVHPSWNRYRNPSSLPLSPQAGYVASRQSERGVTWCVVLVQSSCYRRQESSC